MGLTTYANDLDRAILYYSSDGTWRTLHPRWDIELLAYIFSFNNKNLIKIMKDDLTYAVQSIFRHCDEHIIGFVMITLYATIASNKFVSIDIINSILPIVPDQFGDKFKLRLYTLVGMTYDNLSQHQESMGWLDKDLEIDPNNTSVLQLKVDALSSQGKYQEAIESYDKALKLDPNDVNALNNKGLALKKLG